MGRWRPPAEKSTALITPEGHARLKAELDDLWRVRRPEVVRALAAAAAEGDRSENAEYTYRKKQLGEIDRRVRYLSKRLEVLRVIGDPPTDRDAVFPWCQGPLGLRRPGRIERHRGHECCCKATEIESSSHGFTTVRPSIYSAQRSY